MFSRLALTAILAAAVGDAQAMEISREQCELIRGELIISVSNARAAQEGLRRAQLAMLDLVALNFQLQHLDGKPNVTLITDRVQKAVDEVSAANREALAGTSDNSAKGALAFMDVCGPPPQ
ncbi:hypothetical protein MesoLj131c_63910 [Mesorhizobium sp. 131-3-5]|jgi:hypothetical protein|uniref:hypothetical protein n=1 Tax=unclassified Mesorhizobium TaxID=325217 RepID=UPI001925FDB8|nr:MULTISPECIES: hypothetical protein [unclassified Mesorhizobium]BCH04719.1 hypothetical protein MesoLj131b_67180 [Mesorhizobium sp. 131-2-5]BCH12133.1 hypothetical protein MesoLj131c_63910 [Mesorhizobium sp. 131-3-5]